MSDDESDELSPDKELHRIAQRLGLGATGRAQPYRLGPDDQGQLKSAVIEFRGQVVILFGTPVVWLRLPPEGALALGHALIDNADRMMVERGRAN